MRFLMHIVHITRTRTHARTHAYLCIYVYEYSHLQHYRKCLTGKEFTTKAESLKTSIYTNWASCSLHECRMHSAEDCSHYTKTFDVRSSFCCRIPKRSTSDATIGLPDFLSLDQQALSSKQDMIKLLTGQDLVAAWVTKIPPQLSIIPAKKHKNL